MLPTNVVVIVANSIFYQRTVEKQIACMLSREERTTQPLPTASFHLEDYFCSQNGEKKRS